MNLTAQHFPAEFARSAHLARGGDPDAEPLVAFAHAPKTSLLVRATAFVFADPRSRTLHELIERIAPSEATVLITGETGTGKELIARHVHSLSRRREGKFVAINCGAFSETLIESELFGYERGAFTGASQTKPGWFESANGGTLFLDEIGDLPMPMQVKLLRVLQEREVVRLGARRPIPIDVRLMAATNVDLASAVRAGRFREDLYYRLQVVSLPLLPLRERPGDVMPLTRHFLQTYSERLHLDHVTLAPDAELALRHYPWPGNIRELENVIHRALLVCRDGVVTAADLSLSPLAAPLPQPAAAALPASDTGTPPYLPPPATHASSMHASSVQASLATAEPAPLPDATPVRESERFHAAWQALLDSGEQITFEALQLQLVMTAWESSGRNQLRTARYLNISRNVVRTYLKKAGVLT
ncbi:sigma-54 interaction domain-containing protein [Pseudoduganella umbonata]|uniref:Sigma-54-dependent Fis family transcriptional regulator n=1 Tax=Pseudoduganella umbonata TaxID=864828 RepID=A0A4P8HSQ2_9BURK|nr:sigma 54-interacting transcriptional regulator [Pseudoduganella umbonata]MBB3225251.1 sigma-54-specific transcriptional regulator [Pseudoduganella umbonata]QCP12266.1 sigma-54-dependent Fis family transcriptional regulator [Pseudoduganella umbonata]